MPLAAPSRCNEPGCPEYSSHRGRCEEHQRKPWEGRAPFRDRYGMTSHEWSELTRAVLRAADYVCASCGLPGADVADHIIPVARGGALRDLSNLQALHEEPCHAEKSKLDAAHGSAIARRRRRAQRGD